MNGFWTMLVGGCCAMSLALNVLAGEPLKLPFANDFTSAEVDANWSKTLSPHGTVTAKDGWVTCEAASAGRAQLQRDAGIDDFTISATVARWAAVYVVWDKNNWCAVGKISPTPFGRYFSVDAHGGTIDEIDHRGVDFNSPSPVRMQIGDDHVRFEYLDGHQWRTLRTVERPKDFAGSPKFIAVGKYHSDEGNPFASADAAKSAGGEKISGAIRELRVDATPAADVKLSDAEVQAIRHPPAEPVGALLTQSQDDPTYQQVAQFYPAMKSPREIVGVAAHPLDIGVDWLGRLDVSPWTPPLAWFEFGDNRQPFAMDGQPITRRLGAGWLPIDTLNTSRDGIDYEIKILGASENFLPTKDLYAYVRLSARTSADVALPASASLVFDGGKTRKSFKLTPAPGGRMQCEFRFKYPDPASVQQIPSADFDQMATACATVWADRIKPAMQFDLPDARVSEAYKAWLVYSMLNADTINGFIEPHDGAGFYEEMFGVSVSAHTMALDQYGLHDYASTILDTQRHFQRDDGLYTQACGLMDPGSLLAALASHYRMTGDAAWLKRVSPTIIKQCDWLIAQRKQAPKDGMMRGLIKFRPYNDFPDPTYNFLGNAWCVVGMESAGAALKEIDDSYAGDIAKEAATFRADLLASMDASAFTDSGQTILPMEPDTHRVLKLNKGKNIGGDYYGLVASSLLETGFLPSDDKRAKWIVDTLEQRGGLVAGVCEFHGGIDHAYAYGYLTNALQLDQVRKPILGLWSYLAFGMTRETYSPVEVTMINDGDNQYTLPHLYSCTEQLRLLRSLLVREDGNILWLGQAIPRPWLEAGQQIAVKSAATEFGDVSYKIVARENGVFQVTINPPVRKMPAEIRLRLRGKRGDSIRMIQSTPEVQLSHTVDTITLPQLARAVELEVKMDAAKP